MAVTAKRELDVNGIVTATWTGDASAGNGPAVLMGDVGAKTVQRISGTGTYTVEGSNDGTTWGALGTAISAKNDAVCYPIPENPKFLRVVTAAAAATVVIAGVEL